MDFAIALVIVVMCYVIGEIFKALVRFNKEMYKYIPVIVMVSGGILGGVCYLIDPNIMFNVSNIVEAIVIGIFSGSVSTSSHQVIKKLLKVNK